MKKIFTLTFLLLNGLVFSQNFTAGNLVVLRAGDGVAALTSASTAIFLYEYTPAGVFVQSLAMPTTGSGANKAITCNGTATSEGFITRTLDGLNLILCGYDAATGVAGISSTASTANNRVVAKVNYQKIINSSMGLTDGFSASNFRGAVSTDGTDIWMFGTANAAANGGVRYATYGSTTSTQLSSDVTNIRTANIFNGQLYMSTGSGAFRVASIGTGLPTTTGQTTTNLPGYATSGGSPYQFFMADLDAGIPGLDVLYVADDGATTGIQKYSLVGGLWVANGSVAVASTNFRGITASVSGNTVTMYFAAQQGMYSLVDNTGYNVTIPATLPTLLAAAPINTAFRGIAFAPLATALPIKLTSFNAVGLKNSVNLSWLTYADETGGKFEIERSVDGSNFENISTINANSLGNASYEMTDRNLPTVKTLYYRLKIINADGRFEYSTIQKVQLRNVKLSVSPNPASNEILVNASENIKSVEVYDIRGRRIMVKENINLNQTRINVTTLKDGTYIVKTLVDGEVTTNKIMVKH